MLNIKRIIDTMKMQNLSKTELVKRSGLSRVTIDKILSGGKFNVDTLEALAKGLEVKVGYFFEDSEEGLSIQATSGSSATLIGNANVGQNQAEHDELIKLREEVKYLKEMIKDKDERINEFKERIAELKGGAK